MVEIEERLVEWSDIILGNVEVHPPKILSSLVNVMAENVQLKGC